MKCFGRITIVKKCPKNLLKRMVSRMILNSKYSERLHSVIPGGAHTYSRGDDQYPVNAPAILKRGEGCYVWDEDDKKLLDYGMALRAVTIGYANKRINEAAIRQINNGNNLTRPSFVELEAAELMVSLFDGLDMVKFAKNGSTVTTAAVKLARAYTGKKYIARCYDHPFFSYDDWFIGNTVIDKGVPEEIKKLTLSFRYNDVQSLVKLFDEYNNDIAAVILEPAADEEPKDNFLHKVKDLCHQRGAIFILDEMITGFRYDLRGAQHYYNIIPDLATFGKGMANGFSVAALAGRREIMELGGIQKEGQERVFLISTTHGAEMSSLGAFVEVVNFYKEFNVTDHLWNYGKELINGMNSIARELGIDNYFKVVGVPVNPNYVTYDNNNKVNLSFRTLFAQEMIKNGILMPWIALSYAHGEEELEMTLEATRKSLEIYRRALEDGVDKYLVGRPIKPVFRKYN